MEGIGFYCGIVMRWFRDAFCELEAQRRSASGQDVYALLERKAADSAARRERRLRHLLEPDAARTAGSTPRRASSASTSATPPAPGRSECFRAIEESAAYVSRGHLAIVEEVAGLEVGEAVLTGGAAKGTLWPQILADTLGMPVRIPEVKESTALGAAIYAGVGAGIFDDASEVGGATRAVRAHL